MSDADEGGRLTAESVVDKVRTVAKETAQEARRRSSSDQLRYEIERTRAQMDSTFDDLERRVTLGRNPEENVIEEEATRQGYPLSQQTSGLERGLRVSMELTSETVMEAKFIQESLSLTSGAEAVASSVALCALLLAEVRRGSTIYVEHNTGLRSKVLW